MELIIRRGNYLKLPSIIESMLINKFDAKYCDDITTLSFYNDIKDHVNVSSVTNILVINLCTIDELSKLASIINNMYEVNKESIVEELDDSRLVLVDHVTLNYNQNTRELTIIDIRK